MKPSLELVAHRSAVASNRQTTLQVLVRILPPLGSKPHTVPLDLALALDRSGSMVGRPLEHAKAAARLLLEKLRPCDRISLVTFDSEAQVVISGDEAYTKAELGERIDSIQVGGYTNLHQGWLEACWQLSKLQKSPGVKRTIVLSDGQANTGLTDTSRICRQVDEWSSRGVGTSTVGLGLEYNEELLARMALAGGGDFFHAPAPEDVVGFFEGEFQSMGLTYGRTVGLHSQGLGGAKVLRVYNPLQSRTDGTLRLSDLVLGCPKEVVFELSVPPTLAPQKLCRFVLSYTDIEQQRRCRVSASLTLAVVQYGQLVEFPENVVVLQKRNLQLAARAMAQATKFISSGRPEEARRTLDQALGLLRETEQNAQLMEAAESLRSMLQSLQRREYEAVKKRSLAGSTSLSRNSLSVSGGPLSEWLKLPPSERTQERLKRFFDEHGWD